MAISESPPPLRDIRAVKPEDLEGDKIQRGDRLFGLIWINPQRVSGAACFYGSRVPVKTLFDCLAAGQRLEDFLEDFEGVTREQAVAVLELAAEGLLRDLNQSHVVEPLAEDGRGEKFRGALSDAKREFAPALQKLAK